MKNDSSNLKDNFKLMIEKLGDRFGEGTLQFLDKKENNFNEDKIIKSGSYFLDSALGIGGYPRGRIIEIYGAESCGKTTLALKAVAQCQKIGGKAVYIDAEHAVDSVYAEKLGVDLNQIVLCQPNSGEQAFSIIEALIKTDLVDLIIVDSVAALTPQAELDGDFDEQTIGLQARMMSKGLRIIQNLLNEKTTVIFINQIRDKITLSYSNNNTTTSGGRALKFFASIRIETKKVELIKSAEEVIGFKSKILIVKNKVAPPLKTAFLDFYFGNGFSYQNEIFDLALEHGIIKKSGSWYSFEDTNIAQGKETAKNNILNNNELFNKIKTEVEKNKLI